ncbi:MAG: iron-sulfur cluster-binding protein [Verrucomicrobia bacterium]|nr:iron-sulfur cluster-binding protein [Verrucomicrobiota bacterium]
MSFTFASKFKIQATKVTADLDHRAKIRAALKSYETARDERKAQYQDWQAARHGAASIKWESLNHLDAYLVDFVTKLSARGTKVFWAGNAQEARDYIVALAKEKRAHTIIKSKTMTSEEIHLNEALRQAGYEVVESDLGEFIVQLRGEAPYHLVFPAMHLTRHEISDLFHEKLHSAPSEHPEELTMIARKELRFKYIQADIGISGANFGIAETGMISITENEGNGRLTTALPKVHVALMGIEKVIPRLSDLALFLPLLATAGTGQQITCYNSLIGGPRQSDEPDGPDEFHLVLLDNNRTQLLADAEQRDALHCIRCGACLNACPIFRNVGGHTYGTTYQGPIGSVITPHLRGLMDWKHLSYASSLCGACTEVCPVKINLHHHLLHNRRNAVASRPDPSERAAFRLFAFLTRYPGLVNRLARISRPLVPFVRVVKPILPAPIKGWLSSRDLPKIARESFRDYWKKR